MEDHSTAGPGRAFPCLDMGLPTCLDPPRFRHRNISALNSELGQVLSTAVQSAALVAEASPERKDVVIAVLGASAALGGFVLVFLGTVIAAYQSLPPGASKSVRDRNTQAKWPIVIAFSLSLASVALGLIWLVAPGGTNLYRVTIALFAVELAAILLLAVWTTFRMLR